MGRRLQKNLAGRSERGYSCITQDMAPERPGSQQSLPDNGAAAENQASLGVPALLMDLWKHSECSQASKADAKNKVLICECIQQL